MVTVSGWFKTATLSAAYLDWLVCLVYDANFPVACSRLVSLKTINLPDGYWPWLKTANLPDAYLAWLVCSVCEADLPATYLGWLV